MRLIKTFGLAVITVLAAMAFVGATSAWATSTQLCKIHTGLTCPTGEAITTIHAVLAPGTVAKLLGIPDILCLGALVEYTALGLGSPQSIHSTQTFTGCGTGNGHYDCTVSIPTGQGPLYDLLKTGLDAGTLTATSGQMRLQCPLLFGLDCLYDVAGMESAVGGGHVTAEESVVTELGGKFLCPNGGGVIHWLLVKLDPAYVLG